KRIDQNLGLARLDAKCGMAVPCLFHRNCLLGNVSLYWKCAPLVMLMKDVVHNLPRPIDFEEREQVSEAAAVPVIEFQPDPSNRVDDVDTDDPGVEPCGWGIVVHSVKEELDRASKELPIGIAEDGRVLVEGGFHLGASASLRTIDIMLDRLGNRLILA